MEELLATTLQALINEEQERTADARDRLGSFVLIAEKAIALLNTCVATIERDHFLAAALMLATQKSATLCFLSYIRGHIAQAEFNMRQTIEFTVLTAYMIAHPLAEIVNSSDVTTGGFKSPKSVSSKAYRWLDSEHGLVSSLLKEIKSQINDTTAHASVYLTHFTFKWESGSYNSDAFKGSFFDDVNDDVFRLYIMSFTRLLVIVVETIRQVSETHKGFELSETVTSRLRSLDAEVNAHRDALAKKMGMSSKLQR